MLTKPVLPLHDLLRSPWPQSEQAVLDIGRAACAESLSRIEALRSAPSTRDRDTQACLAALAGSLEWALASLSSANELMVTVRRAAQVFDRLSTALD